eukprot:Hpha_TRINITY_DN7051_c0_g1::TRINITY_DN7051_c0_g1_i2::g.22911::m.22911
MIAAVVVAAAASLAPRVVSISSSSSSIVRLAVAEARLALYHRAGGKWPGLETELREADANRTVVVGLVKDLSGFEGLSGGEESHWLVPTKEGVACVGGGERGVLYASHLLWEWLGGAHHAVWSFPPPSSSAPLPDLTEVVSGGRALFDTRGVLPYHDFPMGPDWWGASQFKGFASQLSRMKMNQDWGLKDEPTSRYCCGSEQLYTADAYGSLAASGLDPTTIDKQKEVVWVNAAAGLLNESFSFARQYCGVTSGVGFEVPLINAYPFVPNSSRAEFLEGTVRRVLEATPVEHLWLWTPEGYAGGEVQEVVADVLEVCRTVGNRSRVVMSGWNLGPQGNRTVWDGLVPDDVVLSSLDRNIGWDPVDPSFGDLKAGRESWVIPWLEDDPGLAGPQLWVDRSLQHARDAVKYGARGLLGIHWRTMEVAPQLHALSRLSWNSSLTATTIYSSFCLDFFGLGSTSNCTSLFLSIDSFAKGPAPSCGAPRNPWGNCSTRLPSPNMGCCGRVSAGSVDMTQFDFVERFGRMRGEVQGDEDKLWWFDWWYSLFRYFRALGEAENAAEILQQSVSEAQKLNGTVRKDFIVKNVIPRLGNVSRWWENATLHLQLSVASPGQLGTLSTNEQNNWGKLTAGPLQFLSQEGIAAPPSALPSVSYSGHPRLVVPLPLRPVIPREEGELCLQAWTLGAVSGPRIEWNSASGEAGVVVMQVVKSGRGVWEGCVRPLPKDHMEWRVVTGGLRFPAGRNATVLVV